MAVEAEQILNPGENGRQSGIMEFHEVANIFPLMEGQELQVLVDGIRQNGLMDPIWAYQGKIVDGRNRYRACIEAGVDPRYREWSGCGSLASFVISLNLHRRHLSESQRSIVGARVKKLFEDEARQRQLATLKQNSTVVANLPQREEPHKSREDAARSVNVSPRSIQSGIKVLEQGIPELADAVMADKIAVSAAAALVDQPAEYQQKVVQLVESGEAKSVVDARRLLRREEAKAAPVMDGKYRVIYADPPWNYGDKRDGHTTGAEDHYPSMTIQELCDLPVKDLAEDNAVLFLWVTSPLLEECFQVIEAWGFQYKASFIWDKMLHNLGHYNSVRHELLLVCTRGSCLPDNPKLYDSVVSIERGEHSVKPDEFRQMIDDLYPNGARIELFARRPAPGWVVWGNEAKIDVQDSA
jgi:N6-adenosine-specific RNA methylase IME4